MLRKKVLCFLMTFALVVGFSGTSFAQQKTDDTANENSIKKETLSAFENFKKEYPDAKIIYPSTSGFTALAPAPPLTAMWVDQVGSTNYGGWEYVRNKYTTTGDHGGAELYVYTYERGYASSRLAQMNSGTLKQWDYQLIDENGDSIIDGFFIGWDACGYESGQFTYQARSSNSPWNTMSTWINIK